MRGIRRVWLVGLCVLGCSSGEELSDTGFTTLPPNTTPGTMPMTSVGTTTAPGTTDENPTDGVSDSDGDTSGNVDPDTGSEGTTMVDPSAASLDTEVPAICGNGVTEMGEECDDGNQEDSDGCLKTCVAATCGDLIVQVGVEDCDDANADETDSCISTCNAAVCGDGFVQAGVEGCDDGNAVDNDACSNACKSGACGDGVVQMGEQCDDMNADNTDACLSTCLTAKCGDGAVQAGVEQCDGGGENPQCNGDCTVAACGDSKVNASAGEQCDTGGQTAQCDGNCTAVQCGDGTLNPQAGEACDDGNANNGDGCSAACQPEIVQVCTGGNDPKTGNPWVVCAADQNNIWISHNSPGNGGQYHAQKICQDLGYPNLAQFGGTCANVCGYCSGGPCNSPGPQNYDGGGACGNDELGPILCFTVMWRCTK